MQQNSRLSVGVVFGGRSVEHDVSILTGLQIVRALDKSRYDVIPLYIARSGEWYTGRDLLDLAAYRSWEPRFLRVQRAAISADTSIKGVVSPIVGGLLRPSKVRAVDVIFPALHGTNGEDGSIQGL